MKEKKFEKAWIPLGSNISDGSISWNCLQINQTPHSLLHNDYSVNVQLLFPVTAPEEYTTIWMILFFQFNNFFTHNQVKKLFHMHMPAEQDKEVVSSRSVHSFIHMPYFHIF